MKPHWVYRFFSKPLLPVLLIVIVPACTTLKDINQMSTSEAASEVLSPLRDPQLCISTLLYNVSPNCFTWFDRGYTDPSVCKKLAAAAVYETRRRGRAAACDAYLQHYFNYSLADASRFRSLEYSELLKMDVGDLDESFVRAMNRTGEFAASPSQADATSSHEPSNQRAQIEQPDGRMALTELPNANVEEREPREPKKLWIDEDGGDFVDIQEEYVVVVNAEPNEWFTVVFDSARKKRPILFCIDDGENRDSLSGDCIEGDSGYEVFSRDGTRAIFFEASLLHRILANAERRLSRGDLLKVSISDMITTFSSLFLHRDYELDEKAENSASIIQDIGQPDFGNKRFGLSPTFQYVNDNGQPAPLISIPSSNRAELHIRWECTGSYIMVLLIHPWFAGNSNKEVLVQYQFDDDPPASGIYLKLYQPEFSTFGLDVMEKFTRRAISSQVLTLSATDPADGETVTGKFLLGGLDSYVDRLSCRFVNR